MGFFHVKKNISLICLPLLRDGICSCNFRPYEDLAEAAGLVPDIPKESFVVETRGYFSPKMGGIITHERMFFFFGSNTVMKENNAFFVVMSSFFDFNEDILGNRSLGTDEDICIHNINEDFLGFNK